MQTKVSLHQEIQKRNRCERARELRCHVASRSYTRVRCHLALPVSRNPRGLPRHSFPNLIQDLSEWKRREGEGRKEKGEGRREKGEGGTHARHAEYHVICSRGDYDSSVGRDFYHGRVFYFT